MNERQTLLILGASGDLTARLLLPGLASLLAADLGKELGLLVLGAGRQDWSDEAWRRRVARSFADAIGPAMQTTPVLRDTRYVVADVISADGMQRLLDACEGRPVLFFALPPAVTMRACRQLCGLALPEGTRLALEKPFGTDASSATALNGLLAQVVPEHDVYRIDHFLGMSTVLNIVGLRFANRMLEPVLNRDNVASVDIVYDESIGLEGRPGYYDRAGALIDMIQSHLLQVLSLITMEPPGSLDARELRDKKAAVLQASRAWTDYGPGWSRRARYGAGEVDGRPVSAYADETGVDPNRKTETFAEMVVAVDTSRWAGVPFRLRSGKALARPSKEVVITFAEPALPVGLTGYRRPDRLRIGLAPDRLCLDLNINGPGDPFSLHPVSLVADFGPGTLTAYGEILASIFANDPTLSVRGDTAERCWHIIEPVLRSWRADEVPLEEYPAGSLGPREPPGP